MMFRTISIPCRKKFNAVFRGGQLKAVQLIYSGDTIHLEKKDTVSKESELKREMDRLHKVSTHHAKRN